LSKSKSKTTRTLKNTSNELKQRQRTTSGDMASLVERVKLDLLSLVSHELRTPLTSVLNSLRVLRDEELSLVEKQKFLEMAYRNAERLNGTLNQLLDLSKLVSGRLVCRFHEVNLKHLLMTQLEGLAADAELLGFELQVSRLEKSLEALPVILGDALSPFLRTH
jgi:signal transduction histidine kinase